MAGDIFESLAILPRRAIADDHVKETEKKVCVI